jgi:glycyl-tRNA synthetase beta chain
MNDGLSTVTYQAKLGTIADKVQRVAALAEAIAPQVGVDPALARRAAGLSKADLQSRMVNEFPELQGIAGRYYAMQDPALDDLPHDDRLALANALDEAWQPRYSADDIALSPLGKVLAIAERLDTLAGGFAAGLKPTGNKDPFALRRNALGLARTIIESGIDISLTDLLARAKGLLFVDEVTAKSKGLIVLDDALDLYDFILDRLRGYYADRGVPVQHFNAVAELRPASLYDFDRRIDAIGTFAQLPEAEALAAANKRINNILKKAGDDVPATVDPALLKEPAEAALAEAVEAVYAETGHALAHGDYVDALAHLARLRPQVDAFFDSVMVNADDAALRNNRLALLRRLSGRLGSVAAIEHLSG